jgi:hypothetical protein
MSHFIIVKFSWTPIETIWTIIPKELEYMEGLFKLARRKKDVEANKVQVLTILPTFSIKRVNVNKMHYNKTFHFVLEINKTLSECLSIMATSVVHELGIWGERTLCPLKIVVTHIIFLQLIFLVMYGHHILNYFCLFLVYLISFRFHLINYFEKFNKH